MRIFLEAIIRDQFMPVCLEAADVLGVEAEELMDMYGDAVEVTCNAFDKSLQVMWESMLCNKESLDLAQKVFAVVQGKLYFSGFNAALIIATRTAQLCGVRLGRHFQVIAQVSGSCGRTLFSFHDRAMGQGISCGSGTPAGPCSYEQH